MRKISFPRSRLGLSVLAVLIGASFALIFALGKGFIGSGTQNRVAAPNAANTKIDSEECDGGAAGDGTFGEAVIIGGQEGRNLVRLGDVDGDDILDAITSKALSNHIFIMLGKGDGTFGAETSFRTGDPQLVISFAKRGGDGPAKFALGDVNGDEILDVITANIVWDAVSVFLGNGDGTFILERRSIFDKLLAVVKMGPGRLPAAPNFPTGGDPRLVVLEDVNRDGFTDVVTGNYRSNSISVLLGKGDGTFSAPKNFPAGDGAGRVALGDVNGDGLWDAVTANSNSDDISVLLGHGAWKFLAPANYGTGDEPESIALGDLDGDGDLDVLTANDRSHNISVLLGNGDGTFAKATRFRAGDRPTSIALEYVNNDCMLDVVTVERVSNWISVSLGNGDGTFAPALKSSTGPGHRPRSFALGDLNGDGILDAVTENFGLNYGDIKVLLGK